MATNIHSIVKQTADQCEFSISKVASSLQALNVKFLPIKYLYSIGHLNLELDCYVKEEKLGLHPQYTSVLLAPDDQVTNKHIVSYWQQYVHILTDPETCAALQPVSQSPEWQYDISSYVMNDHETARCYEINSRWGNRAPLLSLTTSDYHRGWAYLRRLGVPEGSWFVCLHAREAGNRPQDAAHRHRDVDIMTYIPAIESIVAHGGWCFRMGDTPMKPLPPMKNVIDYANIGIRSEWMDVFLAASCRFVLGCNSGFVSLANVFGVPCAVTNLIPTSVLPATVHDIGIFKLLWDCGKQRYLTFREIFDSPAGRANFFTDDYAKAGIKIIDSSPEEICALALEMLDKTEDVFKPTDEDEKLQKSFKALLRPGHYSYNAGSKIGRDFLRKYAYLLPMPQNKESVTMPQIRINTDKPVAFDSPDHIQPHGTAQDNSINLDFNRKLYDWFASSRLKVLDLGCSGGGFVKTIIDAGGLAVGVEGSDYSKKMRRAEWATIPEYLFTADITAPFELEMDNSHSLEKPLQFDIITAWEFIEHIREDQLPAVMQNISHHLAPNGVVIMSVSPNEEVINGVKLHQTVADKSWWISKLRQLGFTNHDRAVKYFGQDMVRAEANAPRSFHVVLTRIGQALPFAQRLELVKNKARQRLSEYPLTRRLLQSGVLRDCPMRVIDAGAQGGFESHWDVYGDQIELIGFEPDEKECARLKLNTPPVPSRREAFYPVALYRKTGTKRLYVTKNGVASSFLQPNLEFIQRFPQSDAGTVTEVCDVQTIDLQSFVQQIGWRGFDFLKLDVEGAELDVLAGAGPILSQSLLGLSVEIFFQPYRIGQPTFGEIDNCLRQAGFCLFDLQPERWRRRTLTTNNPSTWYNGGQIMWAQAIYFRDLVSEFYREGKRPIENLYQKAFKLASLAEVFGFPDFAIELYQIAIAQRNRH